MPEAQTEVASWAEVVGPHFDFLEQHGFRRAPELGFANETGVRTIYIGDATAVAVEASTEFQRVGVLLQRLSEGELPATPTWVLDNSDPRRMDEILLAIVVSMRAPKVYEATRAAQGLSPSWVNKQLTIWAELLRRLVPEFLDGDTRAIDEAEAMIRGVAHKSDSAAQT